MLRTLEGKLLELLGRPGAVPRIVLGSRRPLEMGTSRVPVGTPGPLPQDWL